MKTVDTHAHTQAHAGMCTSMLVHTHIYIYAYKYVCGNLYYISINKRISMSTMPFLCGKKLYHGYLYCNWKIYNLAFIFYRFIHLSLERNGLKICPFVTDFFTNFYG